MSGSTSDEINVTRSWNSNEFDSDFTDDEIEIEVNHLANLLDKLESRNN